MLNSTEHKITTAHKTKLPKSKEVSCFKSPRCGISLRKQTYLTYTMNLNPGRRSPGFKLALTSGEDFLPTHRAVSSSGKPHKDMSLSHFGALKSDAV